MGGGRRLGRWLWVISLLAVSLLVLAGAAWVALPKKNVVTIKAYPGTPGLKVQGTAEVDGVSQELTGTVPARFVLQGYRVTYSLTSPADAGEFRVKVVFDGLALGSSGSGDPPTKGVRGWVKSNWGWESPSHWIESFTRDDDKGWMTPPP
jgi:hypothetical protein